MDQTCPHCGKKGYLIRHGPLINSKGHLRGQRLFCSNRCRKKGCGRTNTVFLAAVLPHRQITAIELWNFMAGVKSGMPKLHAMKATSFACSESSVYRLYRDFSLNQSTIRTNIFRINKPPGGSSEERPEMGTLEDLSRLTPDGDCPFVWFQRRFQKELLSHKDRFFTSPHSTDRPYEGDNKVSVMDCFRSSS